MISLKPTPIWDGYRRGGARDNWQIAGIADIAGIEKGKPKPTTETRRHGEEQRKRSGDRKGKTSQLYANCSRTSEVYANLDGLPVV
jgi:hypothetical protein